MLPTALDRVSAQPGQLLGECEQAEDAPLRKRHRVHAARARDCDALQLVRRQLGAAHLLPGARRSRLDEAQAGSAADRPREPLRRLGRDPEQHLRSRDEGREPPFLLGSPLEAFLAVVIRRVARRGQEVRLELDVEPVVNGV